MLTKVISLKDYRANITKLWKEAAANNTRYIVLHYSKPILDVKPYPDEELFFDAELKENEDYYKTLEQSLDFWNSPEDDDIFEVTN